MFSVVAIVRKLKKERRVVACVSTCEALADWLVAVGSGVVCVAAASLVAASSKLATIGCFGRFFALFFAIVAVCVRLYLFP